MYHGDLIKCFVFADAESISVPQNGEKKKEKRRLGILEMATKEFEDESEVRFQNYELTFGN